MGGFAGKNFLLKTGNGATPEVFTTIGGLRSTQLHGKAEAIDISSIDSADWKQLLGGAGLKEFSVSGSGIFSDSASETQVRDDFIAGTLRNYEIIDGDGNTWAGAFKVVGLEAQAEYKGAQTYSVNLQSSGVVTFTAHV